MKYNRRRFVKLSGGLATGIALSSLGCKLGTKKEDNKENAQNTTPETKARNIDRFGIQVYTLRDDMPKDPKGVLKQLADFGYKQIESFEGPMGMFWGMTNTEFKKYLDGLGLAFISSHCDHTRDLDKKASEAAAIGATHLVCPWVGPQKTLDDFKKIADDFNKAGETCRKAGLRFAYHNHDYSFVPMNDQMPQDVLMQGTDPALVDYEMDIYWVVTAGQDPITWLKKYPNRFRLSHVKDRMKDVPLTEKHVTCDLGTGIIDFPKVLAEAATQGMQYFHVEQERYDNSTPLESAKAGAAYMKNLKLQA